MPDSGGETGDALQEDEGGIVGAHRCAPRAGDTLLPSMLGTYERLRAASCWRVAGLAG